MPLHVFVNSDGSHPDGGLLQGSDGWFYGTTVQGGTITNCSGGCGTVFRINSAGAFTNVCQFGAHPSDGQFPETGLIQGGDGCFYGATINGGTNGDGTVFKLTIPLGPPANQVSSVQPDSSGTNLVFSIPSVAGETYQLQFSPSMNPTNWVNVPNVSITNSIGAMLTLTNFGGAVGPQGYYRFAITP